MAPYGATGVFHEFAIRIVWARCGAAVGPYEAAVGDHRFAIGACGFALGPWLVRMLPGLARPLSTERRAIIRLMKRERNARTAAQTNRLRRACAIRF